MSYDAELAERIRGLLRDELDVTEKRMFGGLTFLVNGNMSVTVSGRGGLMVRLDPDDAAARLDGDVVTPFEMRGQTMKFIGRVCGEYLNINLFWSLAHARVVMGDWKEKHIHHRPHSALSYLAPARSAAACIH